MLAHRAGGPLVVAVSDRPEDAPVLGVAREIRLPIFATASESSTCARRCSTSSTCSLLRAVSARRWKRASVSVQASGSVVFSMLRRSLDAGYPHRLGASLRMRRLDPSSVRTVEVLRGVPAAPTASARGVDETTKVPRPTTVRMTPWARRLPRASRTTGATDPERPESSFGRKAVADGQLPSDQRQKLVLTAWYALRLSTGTSGAIAILSVGMPFATIRVYETLGEWVSCRQPIYLTDSLCFVSFQW